MVWMGPCGDITCDMLTSIDEYTVALLVNLH